MVKDVNGQILRYIWRWAEYFERLENDTRILLGIKDEGDTQILQNDLHKLYKRADTNNMKFNANKFELLRYGKEQEINLQQPTNHMMIQT